MNTKTNLTIFNFQFSINIFLLAILLLAVVLRFYRLGEYPIHLTNDEAGIGYNAYSILKTGRDEHGEFMPIIFKSFGDWKPGLYIYATVPSVFLFGLTEFAVRFPSAVAGIGAVYLVYLLSAKLFNFKTALFASLALTIMPWHIHFSRGGWEANLALTLLLFGIWFFYKSMENRKYLLASALFFGLTLWTYQSAKIASLLPLLCLILLYFKKILSFRKTVLFASVLLGLALALPIVLSIFSGKGGRLEVMSVFSYARPEEYIEESILDHEDITKDSLTFSLFHSEAFNFIRGISGRYLNYFSGKFLFFEGDWSSLRHSSPNIGYLLFAEIPILIIGLYKLLRRKADRNALFILLWLALAPIPAALTRDSVHGVRALNLVIPISIVLGIGLSTACKFIKSLPIQSIKLAGYGVLVLLFVYSMFLYLDAYYVQNAHVNAENYFYGYRETVYELQKLKGDKSVVFNQSFDQPYIFFLFYNKYDPAAFQKTNNYQEGINGDVGFVTKLGDIDFRPINWALDKQLENTLIVGRPEAFPMEEISKPEDYNVVSVLYPNGNDAFLIVEPL